MQKLIIKVISINLSIWSPLNILVYFLMHQDFFLLIFFNAAFISARSIININISSILTFILSSSFCNFTFFIPIFLDFFVIFSIFFFKCPINISEIFICFNSCYSILFIHLFSLFFQIQFITFLILDNYYPLLSYFYS